MKRWVKKHPILFVLLLLVAVAIAAGAIRSRRPELIPVRVEKAEIVDELISIVSASGEIRAHDVVDIQAEVAGVIVELPVVEGQRVSKGDILLRMDPFQAQTELDTAQARYLAGQAELKRAQSTIATAEANEARQRQLLKTSEAELVQAEVTCRRDRRAFARQKELLDSDSTSEDIYEDYEAKAKVSASRVEVARARIEQSKAQLRAAALGVEEQRALAAASEQNLAAADAALKRAKDLLDKVTIASPLDGVIVRLNVDVGERAVPGIQSNPQATLMTIANLSVIEAELEVDETDIVRVAIGHPAEIEVDALSDTTLEGTVAEISIAPIPTSGQEGKDFKVVITIADPPATLRMGMSCEAAITVATRTNVLVIPIQALTTREVPVDADGKYLPPPKPEKKKRGKKPAADATDQPKEKRPEDEIQGVFVRDAEEFAHYRPVKVGIMGEMTVEIEEGLEEGEEVMTGPLQSLRNLREWSKVEILPEEEDEW